MSLEDGSELDAAGGMPGGFKFIKRRVTVLWECVGDALETLSVKVRKLKSPCFFSFWSLMASSPTSKVSAEHLQIPVC